MLSTKPLKRFNASIKIVHVFTKMGEINLFVAKENTADAV
jgi:hypothetical protein